MATYQTVKKVGLIDGANATINAATQTFHPGKIIDDISPTVPKYNDNPLAIFSPSGYEPQLVRQGKYSASVDILCEFRDCRQIFMLMGAVSNGGSAPNLTHEITVSSSRPSRPQTVYAEMSGGTSDIVRKHKNCRIQSIEITSALDLITTEKLSFALGEKASNTKLTTYPIAYPTEHDAPFYLDGNQSATWNSNEIGGLSNWHLVLERAVDPKYYHQSSGERYPWYNDAKKLSVKGGFIHKPDSANDAAILTDAEAGTLRTLYFKLYKGANNYVEFTFANTLAVGTEMRLPTTGGGEEGVMVYAFFPTTTTIKEYSQVLNTYYT